MPDHAQTSVSPPTPLTVTWMERRASHAVRYTVYVRNAQTYGLSETATLDVDQQPSPDAVCLGREANEAGLSGRF